MINKSTIRLCGSFSLRFALVMKTLLLLALAALPQVSGEEPGLMTLLTNPGVLFEKARVAFSFSHDKYLSYLSQEIPYDVTKVSRNGRVHISFCTS